MHGDECEHVPVMLREVLAGLEPRSGGIFLDCTFGRGGHTRALLARIGPGGRVLVMDKDPEAAAVAVALSAREPRLRVMQGAFDTLESFVRGQGVLGEVDGVLFDLGVSSPQLADPSRGFGFRADGPLDMRMDPRCGVSAAAWLQCADEAEIADVIARYGEERHARRIARAIVRARAQAPLTSTGRLAEVVAAACPTREPGKHPATRTFQAIRIHLNRELEELTAALPQATRALRPGGRLVVISFHSLEDRIVKRFIRDYGRPPEPPPGLPVTGARAPGALRALGRAQRPGAREVAENPRARSAVLRVAERRA